MVTPGLAKIRPNTRAARADEPDEACAVDVRAGDGLPLDATVLPGALLQAVSSAIKITASAENAFTLSKTAERDLWLP
jgi:hypothetical protein